MAEQYVCAVSVASIWSNPNMVREIDKHAISNPVSIFNWIDEMTKKERDALCRENRLHTQVLYGELLEVDTIQGEWAKVRAVEQPYRDVNNGYPGWIPIAQLKEKVEREAIGYMRVKEPRTQLYDQGGLPLLVLSFNTMLPVLSEESNSYTVAIPHGQGKVLKAAVDFTTNKFAFPKKTAQAFAEEMLKFLDIPYFWAGMSSYGYDCSGLTYNAMKACGYKIPRDASDQAKGGQKVSLENRAAWQVGDLLFFASNGEGRVRHVGIYIGKNRLLHTSIAGGKVEVIHLQGHQLDQEIVQVRRYL
ncbi:NlpC/P60 family protein [Lysinibacillus sp. LZ02]|uniref:C40 family peptidase n=1 Tax=Lysinibacillus sp. LZ02 TaxID=3420668 RepID=UPI003D36FB4F